MREVVQIGTAAEAAPFLEAAEQKLFPSKRELLLEDLALGSFNLHRAYFGSAFELSAGGAPAFTACVAFGLERWIWAIARRHGCDVAAWPALLRPR